MIMSQLTQVASLGVIDYMAFIYTPPQETLTSPGLGGPLKPIIPNLQGNPGQGSGHRKVVNIQANIQDQQPSGV